MGSYEVLAPVIYMRDDGGAVHQTVREVGNVVEVDDEQAAVLVASGQLGRLPADEPAEAVPEPEPEPVAEIEPEPEPEPEKPRRRPRKADDDG